MSDSKKDINEIGEVAIKAVALLLPLSKYAFDKVKEKIDERKDWIEVPELYLKDSEISLDKAISRIEDKGLKTIQVAIKKANVKYRDCSDLQVVRTKPKCKEKVPPGGLVVVKYVTSEIIEESKQLFEELQNHKDEVKIAKAKKKLEQKEDRKKKLTTL